MLTLDSIYKAAFALKDTVRKTDLIRTNRIIEDNLVYIKTENLQFTGAFKLRGAYNKMFNLTEEEKAKGVVACSAGNHSQGVAFAAQKAGVDAVICIPALAPISKIESTKSYGSTVELVQGVYDDAYMKALEIAKETGRTMIHPFEDDEVIAGQATIALEILEQLHDVDVVIVPVGGGGLISGIAYCIKALKPSCKVYGAQAEGASSMVQAIKEDKVVTLDRVATMADGIAVKTVGSKTFEYCKKYVDDVVTVSDDEIASAILALIEKQKLVAEGAGAVAMAAAMYKKVDIEGKKTVCLLSGGNIDVTILSRVISRGLIKQGRLVDLEIEVFDRPKQLAIVSDLVANLGANVIYVEHDRKKDATDLQHCLLRLGLETRDQQHIDYIVGEIKSLGYRCKTI